MIYKGLMGEQEVTLLYNSFKAIYRFVSRGSSIYPLTKEILAEVDIEPEVYNNIISAKNNPNDILILNSNADTSIVTKFVIYGAVSISDWLRDKLEEPDFTELRTNNAIFVMSDTKKPTSQSKTVTETAGDKLFYIESRSSISDISEMELRQIENRIQGSFVSNFNLASFDNYKDEIAIIKSYKADSSSRGLNSNLQPVLFILLTDNRFYFNTLINIGFSKKQLRKNNDIMPGGRTNSFRLKQKFTLTENFQVPNFNDLVDSDAQPLLVKKVKNYINRRVEKIPTTNTDFFELFDLFYQGATIDKNFFTPTNKILNGVYSRDMDKLDFPTFNNEIKELKIGSLNVANEKIEEKIGEAIANSVAAYQEIWGSYKPIQRVFFTGNQKDYMRVRELFYNVLYAYIDKALGGYISGGGNRKYTPKLVEKILKALPALDDNEKEVLRFMNRTDDIDDKTYKKYFTIIEKFMSDRADTLTGENITINLIDRDSGMSMKRWLRKSGFSIKGRLKDNLYLISMIGVEGSGTETFEYLMQNFKLSGNVQNNRFYRNLYQYVLEIDTVNKDLNVIRPSLVDNATQFRINFQDWDIRVELVNLINNLISKPKQLVTGGSRAGLSTPASPREKALELISDERMKQQGVVDHPLTLHYDPMRFNKVTRQTSGHLFFENTNGKLVIFPFDSFYHDMEGQSDRTIDICYTSVISINDFNLFNQIMINMTEAFYTWVNDNKDKITLASNHDDTAVIVTGDYQPITPQVFKALFAKALQSRLDGHIFNNQWGARAACVYLDPYKQGFYSAADEGFKLGVANFPFDWEVFNRLTGKQTVTSLGSRDGNEYEGIIGSLYAGTFDHFHLEKLMSAINKEKNNLISNLTDISSKGLRFADPEKGIENVVSELFKEFISEATYNNVADDYGELKREEIKNYLKKNPEAIKLEQISRRNLSRN
tara:strand:+ start:5522 stop:8341 length:2820 start_codon:yes stop_codon:yes gene_type:complete